MSKSTIVAFYGPKQLTGKAIDTIAEAINKHTDLPITNETLGGDPAGFVVKYGMVFYSLAEGLPLRMRGGREGEKFTFSKDIKSIVYGNVEIKDQFVYFYETGVGALFQRDGWCD
ncbi:hypothetical protein MMC20_002329 [Loxospora ochrophaea]|nr:hypothetical protein [Loxospora ochrophaea]